MRTRLTRIGLLICLLTILAASIPCAAPTGLLTEPSTQRTLKPSSPSADKEFIRPESPRTYAMDFTTLFLAPLLLTLAIELPVIAIAGRGSGAAWKTGILVNTLTNPVAVFLMLTLAPILYRLFPHGGDIALVGAIEVSVAIAEWRIFRWVLGWTNRRAMTTSLIANGLSFGLGLVLTGDFLRF